MNDVTPLPSDILLEEITALLRELHPQASVPAPRLDAQLDRDLGLDSLSRMELLARLEKRLQVSIPETPAVQARTPADLLRVLAASSSRVDEADVEAVIAASREPLATPDDADTLCAVLAWHAQRHPDRLHVRCVAGDIDGQQLSYGELQAAASETAGGLQRLGLRAGDRVALMFPTDPELLIAFFGVLLAGGVPVPLYPPLRPSELGDYWHRQTGILRNSGARLMLLAPALDAHRHAISAMAGSVERLLTVASLRAAAARHEPVAARGGELALLQYTSGSTADPKGVMLSHANLLANIRIMGRRVGACAADTFVSWLPLYHDMGLIGAWLGSLYFGMPLILMPPQSFLLHPEQWLRAMHRYRATLSAAPNFAYELCLHRVEDSALGGLDLGALRICFCGAEPVFPETMERFATRFARFGLSSGALLPVYGLAENSLGLAFPPVGRGIRVARVERDRFLRQGEAVAVEAPSAPALRFVSCGTVLAAHELRIVDDYDRERPDGWQGRIQFKGPSATSGYFGSPALTRQLFHEGWLDTGDLGFILGGELYLSGRVKDVIIRAGEHLHPQSIEQAVGEVPGIRRGRVVAFGSEREGTERLVVVAETRVGDAARRQALDQAVNAAVHACAGAPADVIVLAAPGTLLKTSSGKLRRSACRSAYETGQLQSPDRWRLLQVMMRAQSDRLLRAGRHAGVLAYGAYAWLLFLLAAVPALLCVALPLSPAARWRAVRRLLRVVAAGAGLPVQARQTGALPEGPCVFVCNHASYVDALALLCALPRPVAFVAKQSLARQPVLGWVLRRLDVQFVERSDPQASSRVVNEVQCGMRDVLFFPEGTFRRMPGLTRFRLGAFVAAAQAGTPVVPLALKGTRRVLRDGEWLPRRARLTLAIAPALYPDPALDPWHDALRMAVLARASMLADGGEPDAQDVQLEIPAG